MVVVLHPHPACHRAVRIGTVFRQRKDSSVRSSQLSTWTSGGGLQPCHPGPVCAGRPRASAHTTGAAEGLELPAEVCGARRLCQAPSRPLGPPSQGASRVHRKDPASIAHTATQGQGADSGRTAPPCAAASPRPQVHPPRSSLANLAKASRCPENQTWESPAAQGPPSPTLQPQGLIPTRPSPQNQPHWDGGDRPGLRCAPPPCAQEPKEAEAIF